MIRGQSPEPPGDSWWDRLRSWPPFSQAEEPITAGAVTPVNYVVPGQPLSTVRLPGGGSAVTPFDPRQPLMAYTRLFDGADPLLTARLRDHFELSGDLRSGGWEAYLHRSEDFIRFTSHLMVVEMLQLHGGEAQRRMVVKWRKHR
jgi:hypothetical protein